ncbi:hypothetical protein AAEX37_00643 [Oligella sp. MSHR50489EDL]|uniref:GtrA family protein n=1 Tax=Oligella sp. MSHR50489EDL TaxID=3139409 RepID=UPI003D8158AC
MPYSVFIRFLINGGLATAMHYAVFLSLLQSNTSGLLATTAGALVGLVCNYLLQYHFTFATDVSHRKAFPSFLMVGLLSCGLNALLFYGLQMMLNAPELIVQIIVTALVTLVNFVLYKNVFCYDALSV